MQHLIINYKSINNKNEAKLIPLKIQVAKNKKRKQYCRRAVDVCKNKSFIYNYNNTCNGEALSAKKAPHKYSIPKR